MSLTFTEKLGLLQETVEFMEQNSEELLQSAPYPRGCVKTMLNKKGNQEIFTGDRKLIYIHS